MAIPKVLDCLPAYPGLTVCWAG